MSWIIGIIGLVFVVVWGLLSAADLLGDILALVGNPIARWLGLQDDFLPGKDLVGRHAKVIGNDGTGLRVELNGTAWSAQSDDINWIPKAGDIVVVAYVNGLTLGISGTSEKVSEIALDNKSRDTGAKEIN